MRLLCSIILLFLMNHTLSVAAYFSCYPTGNSSSSSNYATMRDGLLFTLPGQVKDSGGFYSSSSPSSSSSSGPNCLGLCRKDLASSDACSSCINNAGTEMIRSCHLQKEAVAWGGDASCIIRCAPHQFSTSYEVQPSAHTCNATNVSLNYLPQFVLALANLTRRIANKAAEEGSKSSFPTDNAPQYFATEESKVGDLMMTIYGLGYCLPTLDASDCTACLQAAGNLSDTICHGKEGAMVFTPSCVLRYELYPFYESTSVAPSPPPSIPSPSPPASSSSHVRKGGSKSRKLLIIPIALSIVAVLAILVLIASVKIALKEKKQSGAGKDEADGAESMDSCFEFDFNTIRDATNDFGQSNKLGKGGFGVVYKGVLSNGRRIAVKRLIRCSARTEEEFKNEVRLVARLHHKNLIRLIGFCVGLKERILIYELALNGSLDGILFDPIRREQLNWEIRYNIIEGIARGLLYLHEESQLRIIHRDLKASNVLLDESMTPKIADFGTARLFLEDQATASKIVGTYGYMAPEYAKYGKISVKVDVFSFGVLLLEIVSGRKNGTSENAEQLEHLLSMAWRCWTSGKLMELIDPTLLRANSKTEDITRSIHIGLLCVQGNTTSRPTMNQVILMLEACSLSLPPPLQPAYLIDTGKGESNLPISTAGPAFPRLNDDESDSFHPSTGLSLPSVEDLSVNEVSFTNTYPEPR